MRLPRDLSGRDLIHGLRHFGYEQTRQVGSHVRLTTTRHGTHHVTIPMHETVRVGTLNQIVRDVASHHSVDRDEVIRRLS